jgi:hypothetical protein
MRTQLAIGLRRGEGVLTQSRGQRSQFVVDVNFCKYKSYFIQHEFTKYYILF